MPQNGDAKTEQNSICSMNAGKSAMMFLASVLGGYHYSSSEPKVEFIMS